MFLENKELNATDGLDPTEITRGRAVGGIEALSLAFEQNDRTNSQHSFSHYLDIEQRKVNDALVSAGEEALPTLPYEAPRAGLLEQQKMPMELYDQAGAFLAGTGSEEDQQAGWQMIEKYDQRVLDLRKKRPDLQIPTVAEQFDNVKKKAQESQKAYDARRFSLLGHLGGFVGAAASSFNPMTNPGMVAGSVVLGAANVGRTVLARVGIDAATNAGLEGYLQSADVQRQREILGMPKMTAGQIVADAAIAGAGAGVIRGAGEIASPYVGRAVKRWFPNTPDDPAPPPLHEPLRPGENPTGTGPEAELAVELRDAEAARNAHPEINAQTITERGAAGLIDDSRMAQARARDDMAAAEKAFNDGTDLSPVDARGRTLDDVAREVDPDTFRVYDSLREEADRVRAEIAANNAPPETLVPDLPTNTGKKNKKFQEIEARYNEIAQQTKSVAELRDYQQFLDYKMRDLAPLISRAYARAKGQWAASKEFEAAVSDMVSKRAPVLGAVKEKPSLKTSVNEVSAQRKVVLDEGGGKSVDETVPQALTRIITSRMDKEDQVLEKGLERFAQTIDNPGAPEGIPVGLDLDKVLPLGPKDENGVPTNITLRDFFRESVDDERAMKAVSACRINSQNV